MVRKLPPTEYDIDFAIPDNGSGANVGVLDVNQALSLLNRKMFRQGSQVMIEEVRMITDGDATLSIYRIPDGWATVNAWVKSQAVWFEQQNQVLDTDPSYRAKYRDFKVFMNYAHAAGVTGINDPAVSDLPALYPQGFTGQIADATSAYEWTHSHIQMPNDDTVGVTTEYHLHVMGDSVDPADAAQLHSLGMISGYAASRARPNLPDPNLPDNSAGGTWAEEAWMSAAFDDGDNFQEIREDLQLQNDVPPYIVGGASGATGYTYYPGGQQEVGLVSISGTGTGDYAFFENSISTRSGTALANQSCRGFMANLGLIAFKLEIGTVQPTSNRVRVTVAPGPMKGTMSRPMGDA